MKYKKRQLEPLLREYLASFPVVALTGPRQSGKSTLLRHLLGKEYRYINFDSLVLREQFYADPEGFMATYSDKVIFDEAQLVPELFSYIKIAVDEDRQSYGKFVLSGSSQFHLLQNITESLAGRIGMLDLLPFQLSEVPQRLRKQMVLKGGYPELVTRDYKNTEIWYDSYITTYLERDVRQLARVSDLHDFQRFINLLAANVATILDMQRFATDIGVSIPTIKRWLSFLEASYIIFLLPPYFSNLGKRITKRPKLYFWDSGLVCHLVGMETEKQLANNVMSGAIFENHVMSEIFKKEKHAGSHANFYYYRTSNNVEIDLIVDRKHSKELIEIKFSQTAAPKMYRALSDLQQKDATSYLLYCGKAVPHQAIKIMNYQDYLV